MTTTTITGRARILDEAERLFVERGYRGVSIRDIATACEVTNAALYYHFDNKEDLFLEVAHCGVERMADRMQEAATGPGTLRERLVQLLLIQVEMMAKGRSFYIDMGRDLMQLDSKRAKHFFRHMRAAVLEPFADLLAAGQASGEISANDSPQMLAAMLGGMLHAVHLFEKRATGSKVTQEQIEAIVSVFLGGVENKV